MVDFVIEALRDWIGKTESSEDFVTPVPLAGLAATLDVETPDFVPPLWHWLYFLPLHKRSELGPDGHALRGGFLPPVPLPRRMWAGGRLEFHRDLQVGERISRHSRIQDVSYKEGRSGRLVFVVVRHEISSEAGLAVTEEHDIVYRDLSSSTLAAGTAAPGDASWERVIYPDDVLLFRYSALTFNGHRIHYDRRYAMEVEGYPGLVVHGPLMATLLAELVRFELPDARIRRFEFRAVRPVFDTAAFSVCGSAADSSTVRLWAKDATGGLAMTATATVTH
jgi:3-methylfumaryl-CoA hydratase